MHIRNFETTQLHDPPSESEILRRHHQLRLSIIEVSDERWSEAIRSVASGNISALRDLLKTGLDVEGLFPIRWEEEITHNTDAQPPYPKSINTFGEDMHEDGTSYITLVHLAAKCGQIDVLELLLKYGATLDCASVPLAFQVRYTPLSEAILAGHFDVVQFLLAAGASIHYCIEDHDTNLTFHDDILLRALYLARARARVQTGDALASSTPQILLILLEHGLNLDPYQSRPRFLMEYAVETRQPDIVRIFTERGLGCRDTLSYFVNVNGGAELLDLILSNGARNEHVSTIFVPFRTSNLSDEQRLGLIELVLQRFGDFWSGDVPANELVKSAANSDFLFVRYFVEKGVDVNSRDSRGKTAFMAACYGSNNSEMFKWLLDQGANIHLVVEAKDRRNFQIDDGFTALHCAACGRQTESIRYLLRSGANIDAKSAKGLTPLSAAFMNNEYDPGHSRKNTLEETISLLLGAGADIDSCDEKGRTALHLAANNIGLTFEMKTGPIRALIEAGADTVALDHEGKIPMQYLGDSYHLTGPRAYLAARTSDYELVLRKMSSNSTVK